MATINGNGQANTLIGTLQSDIIRARGGNDTVLGGEGDDSILGNGGDDSVEGGLGNDTIKGGNGNDWLFGGQGNDKVYGNKGDDTLVASLGNDTLNGGNDFDTVVFAGNRNDYAITQINSTTVLVDDGNGNVTRVVNVESFAFADVTQSFAEVLEPLTPNLSINAITITEVPSSGAIDVGWELASNGLADAAPSQSNLVIASAPDLSATIETFGLSQLGTIESGDTATLSSSLDTTGFAPGTYYIGAIADSGDALAESDETDNIQWVEITIEPKPNLTAGITFITETTLQAGELLGVNWGIDETTGNNTGDSFGDVVISLTPDAGAVFDSFGAESVGPLAGNGMASFSSGYDTSSLAPGTYWIAAVADIDGQVAESDETDNFSGWIEITIEDPITDYAMQSVTVLPSSDLDLAGAPGDEGGTLEVEVAALNLGNAGPTEFVVETWLSSDASYSADDILLNETGGAQTVFFMAYDSTASLNLTYELDQGLPIGDYYVISVIQPAYDLDIDDDSSNNLAVSDTAFALENTDGQLFIGTATDGEVFQGGSGDDTLTGLIQSDVFDGGDGFDFIDFSAESTGVEITLETLPGFNDPDAPIELAVRSTAGFGDPAGTITGVESINGTSSDDIIGTVYSDVVYIDGGDGNDMIVSGLGNETLVGGNGNDSMAGDLGDDLIITGDGFDLVGVRRVPLLEPTGDGHDIITDFDVAMDVLLFQYSFVSEPDFDPLSTAIQTADGALFSYTNDSSILLQGVDVADLSASNILEDDPYSYLDGL